MLILGLDFETTGLDKTVDRITEIGAVLWDTELNAPVRFYNALLDCGVQLTPEITKLTGITDDLLHKYGEPVGHCMQALTDMIKTADAVIAHNAPFDRGFYEQEMLRCGYGIDEKKLWADSSVDVTFPDTIETRKLVYLACEHGFVNPFAHRAVTDVLTMLQICSKYSWDDIVANAKTPNVTLWARTTFEEKDIAKKAGYRWNADAKQWQKNVKEHQVQIEKDKLKAKGITVTELKNG